MNYIIPLASESYIIEFPVYDSSSSTGALLAGLTFETASLVAYYDRWGAAGAATEITLATMTKGTYTSGGFVAVDGTNQAGRYQLCIPDAALASGANGVTITLQGAANMVPVTLNCTLLDLASPSDIVDEWETQSQADPTGFHVNVIEVGGTAQTANDNGADINAILVDTNELQTDWTDGGRLDLLLDGASAPTAAQVRAEIDSNSTQLAAIVEDTGTTIPAVLGTPADTDLATDISNIALGSGVTEAALIQYLIALGDD
jgi:hypothetical protein